MLPALLVFWQSAAAVLCSTASSIECVIKQLLLINIWDQMVWDTRRGRLVYNKTNFVLHLHSLSLSLLVLHIDMVQGCLALHKMKLENAQHPTPHGILERHALF